MYAVSYGKIHIVEYLIAKNADVEARNNCGCSALIRAAEDGRKDIVECLINSGAIIDAKANNGQTALTRAVLNFKRDTALYLKGKNARVPLLARPFFFFSKDFHQKEQSQNYKRF